MQVSDGNVHTLSYASEKQAVFWLTYYNKKLRRLIWCYTSVMLNILGERERPHL